MSTALTAMDSAFGHDVQDGGFVANHAMTAIMGGCGRLSARLRIAFFMISFRHFALRRGSRLLLSDIDLVIQSGWRLGVIGRNGCGKSSLFAALQGKLESDAGELDMPGKLRLASVAQETPALPDAGDRLCAGRRRGTGRCAARRGRRAGARRHGGDGPGAPPHRGAARLRRPGARRPADARPGLCAGNPRARRCRISPAAGAGG